MSGNESLHDKLVQIIQEYDPPKVEAVVKEAVSVGMTPTEIIEALSRGVRMVGEKYASGEAFIAELIMAGEVMKAGVSILKPEIMKQGLKTKSLGRIVIGTVKGDLHDIGKNIVITMLEASGFQVFDLGVDVPTEVFVEKAKEVNAEVLGMSALLTVSFPEQGKVVEALKETGLRDRVKVIIGGAAVTPEWAERIEADGYADNAVTGVAKIRKLLNR